MENTKVECREFNLEKEKVFILVSIHHHKLVWKALLITKRIFNLELTTGWEFRMCRNIGKAI